METTLEQIITGRNKDKMISYIKSNPGEFKELIRLALSDKQPYAWRAAWLLRSCTEKNDPRIQKHLSTIIKKLNIFSSAQKRDWFFVLQKLDIPEKDEGLLFDTCVDAWCSIELQPSVRHNAFRIISKMAQKHPELKNEVEILAQKEYTETLSPGIKNAVQKMISQLQKQK